MAAVKLVLASTPTNHFVAVFHIVAESLGIDLSDRDEMFSCEQIRAKLTGVLEVWNHCALAVLFCKYKGKIVNFTISHDDTTKAKGTESNGVWCNDAAVDDCWCRV